MSDSQSDPMPVPDAAPVLVAAESIAALRAYHQVTKHHVNAYASSPGFLDWDSQPDPFRRYDGAPPIPLPLVKGEGRCAYDDLFAAREEEASPSVEALGLFFELALGLSAWKNTGFERWALRNNPSSGNLHPTEGWLVLWTSLSAELTPGLYHYRPFDHALERRATLSDTVAAELVVAAPGAWGALGLSSILWREEWKYGSRAFRYCQHDVGHALAAARFAARVNGWTLAHDPQPSDATVAACLGLDRADDYKDIESEHPDLLAVLGGTDGAVPWTQIAAGLSDWAGVPTKISDERVVWREVAAATTASAKPDVVMSANNEIYFDGHGGGRAQGDAATTIRQRRSAQRMNKAVGMTQADFRRALARTLPRAAPPFDALPYVPAINLLLFVHGVEDMDPGLYLLDRCPSRFGAFKAACGGDFAWEPVPGDLPLYRLDAPADLRRTASGLCCHQGIAGHSAFSLGMIAAMGPVMEAEGGWAYRRLHWEAGMIGQVLYLEAEASGLRGTGIGCFFDDAVHGLLGLGADTDASWQTIYHFTVGGPVEDTRLTTEPAYGHLERGGQS